mgnify:CR=1 FL=1
MSLHILEGKMNGELYWDILENELSTFLENLSLKMRQNMWFRHDSCPEHYSMVAREVLDHDFNGHWIGRADPKNWPAGLPDLSSPDFFLLGYFKEKVYKQV